MVCGRWQPVRKAPVWPRNCSLLRNCNSSKGQQFVPVRRGLPEATRYNHGVSVADYDNDGFPDLLITGYGGVQLLKNQGDGTFTDTTRESRLIQDEQWSSSAAWGDFIGTVMSIFMLLTT